MPTSNRQNRPAYFRWILALVLLIVMNPAALFSQDVVILHDSTHFEVINPQKTVESRSLKVVIYNDDGTNYGRVQIPVNEVFSKFKKTEARITDLGGRELRKLKKDDIYEHNFNPLMGSTKAYRAFELVHSSYPYILEYEFKIEYNSLFFWPDWYPQNRDSTVRSVYVLKMKTPVAFDTFPVNMIFEPEHSSSGNQQKWVLENTPAYRYEDYVAPEHRRGAQLLFKATSFDLEGYRGSTASWDDFGSWYRRLTSGKQKLPPHEIGRVQQLTANLESEREKIDAIYAYMQGNSRYVAIHLGVGGWQPHSAQFVSDKKYGDCKDLSNYMISLLDIAGITAYPALILTRDAGKVYKDFSGNQFNHCIAVAPLPEDTVWLECTADNFAAGAFSYYNEGCNVLVVKEDTSEIVTTPISTPADNRWLGKIEGKIRQAGTLEFSGQFEASGNQSNWYRQRMIIRDTQEQKELLVSAIGAHVPKLEIEDFTFANLDENLQEPLSIALEGKVTNFAAKTASRLFINPNLVKRLTNRSIPDEDVDERDLPVFRYYQYQDIDTVEVSIPFGFKLEAAPEQKKIETPFGFYETQYVFERRKLKYVRHFELRRREVAISEYADYKSFLEQVVKADDGKFVFKKS